MEDIEKKEKAIMERLLKELTIFDKEDVKVVNELTGRWVMLTPQQVAVYDYMNGLYNLNFLGQKEIHYQEYDACKMWILKHNPTAYSTLID